MKLTDEAFIAILHGLAGEANYVGAPAGPVVSAPADGERRRAERQRIEAPLPYTRFGSLANRQKVQLRDLSPFGLGMVVVNTMMAPGEQLVVYPPGVVTPATSRWRRGRASPLDVLCTVRAVLVRRDGTIRVGAEFTAPHEPGLHDQVTAMRSNVDGALHFCGRTTRPSQAQSLLGATAGPGGRGLTDGTRRDERTYHTAPGLMYVVHPDGSHSPIEDVELYDYSAGGVGFLRRTPLEPDQQFMVRVPRVDQPPVTRLCSIARVAQSGPRYLIGARFVQFDGARKGGWLARLIG